jgi:hypothetical protein
VIHISNPAYKRGIDRRIVAWSEAILGKNARTYQKDKQKKGWRLASSGKAPA